MEKVEGRWIFTDQTEYPSWDEMDKDDGNNEHCARINKGKCKIYDHLCKTQYQFICMVKPAPGIIYILNSFTYLIPY